MSVESGFAEIPESELVTVTSDEFDRLASNYANEVFEGLPEDRISYFYYKDADEAREAFKRTFTRTVGRKYLISAPKTVQADGRQAPQPL